MFIIPPTMHVHPTHTCIFCIVLLCTPTKHSLTKKVHGLLIAPGSNAVLSLSGLERARSWIETRGNVLRLFFDGYNDSYAMYRMVYFPKVLLIRVLVYKLDCTNSTIVAVFDTFDTTQTISTL